MPKPSVEDYVIDFSKEDKSGGGRFKVNDGTYLVRVVSAKPVVSGQKQTPGLELLLVMVDGKYKGKKFKETLWATTKAYSRFRTMLEAANKKVPPRIELIKIATGIKGAEFYVELETEEDEDGKYKPRSRVSFEGFINPKDYDPDGEADTDDEDDTEDDDDEEEEEKPVAKKKKKDKKKKQTEDEDVDDDDLDLDEL